jgi:hypothetical protein
VAQSSEREWFVSKNSSHEKTKSVFEGLKEDITRRRALWIAPFAFAGLVAISSRKGNSSEATDSANETNEEVTIVPFIDAGEKLDPARVQKVLRSNVGWRKSLTAEQYYVPANKAPTLLSKALTIRATNAAFFGASAAAMRYSAPTSSSIPARAGQVSLPPSLKRTFVPEPT